MSASKWERLANEAIADAASWKAKAREQELAMRAARACLVQPVQFTGSDKAGASNILRADCKAAVKHLDAVLSAGVL